MREPPTLDRRSALFVDVDGTLLDIAPQPDLVHVPPDLPALLETLAQQHHRALALISGRGLADIDRLFRPWQGAAAGMHGAERRRADGTIVETGGDPEEGIALAALQRLRPRLRAFAARAPGVWVEDKGKTLALHYREAPAMEGAARVFVEQLCREIGPALRLIAGKMVFELQPRVYGKGSAIAAFLSEPPFRGRLPVFLGDDTTDEDGFAEVNRRGGLSIRVGDSNRPTAAAYRLPSVARARAWLAHSVAA